MVISLAGVTPMLFFNLTEIEGSVPKVSAIHGACK
jgi:hypothetical protein